MFIALWIVLIILALVALNTVLLVADAVAPYEKDSTNALRTIIIILGIAAIPVVFFQLLIAAYQLL